MYQLRIVFEQIRIEKERRLVPVPEFSFPLVGHDRRQLEHISNKYHQLPTERQLL